MSGWRAGAALKKKKHVFFFKIPKSLTQNLTRGEVGKKKQTNINFSLSARYSCRKINNISCSLMAYSLKISFLSCIHLNYKANKIKTKAWNSSQNQDRSTHSETEQETRRGCSYWIRDLQRWQNRCVQWCRVGYMKDLCVVETTKLLVELKGGWLRVQTVRGWRHICGFDGRKKLSKVVMVLPLKGSFMVLLRCGVVMYKYGDVV